MSQRSKKAPRMSPAGLRMMKVNQLGQLLTVESVPVVEVVEIDGIKDAAVIGAAYSVENAGAGCVGVDVTNDGGIQCGDGLGIELGGVAADPSFGLNIRRFGSDESEEG